MFQDIFIIGATGNIGKQLIKQIIQNDMDIKSHKNPTRIVGVMSSKSFIYNKDGIEKNKIISFSNNELIGENFNSLLDLIDIIDKDSFLCFIDLTALKEEMLEFHLKVINETKHSIITANKNPLIICNSIKFRELTKNPIRYGYRCSVMAGAESINKIMDLADLNDLPIIIEGCFSGTLGYLTTELENGISLSNAIIKAKELGYTEPNPAVDLSGEDVARKLLILARSVGEDFEYSDIIINPFVEKNLLDTNNFDELINNLKSIDNDFNEKIIFAKKENKTYKYIGKIDFNNKILEVGLKKIDKNSPLGQLNGTSNKIVIVTNTFSNKNPYIVESPGAGKEVTAQNIRRDLLQMINNRFINFKNK